MDIDIPDFTFIRGRKRKMIKKMLTIGLITGFCLGVCGCGTFVSESGSESFPATETVRDQIEQTTEEKEYIADDEKELYELVSTYLDVDTISVDSSENSATVEIESNSATPEYFMRAMAYIYTKNFSLEKPYTSFTFSYRSDKIKEGKCSLYLMKEYGDYYSGAEILPVDETDQECLSEKELLERMFMWTFQIRKCGTCNYFCLFTSFDPSIDCHIEDNVCNIAYPCYPDQDRLEMGKHIRSDIDLGVEHFNQYYSVVPELFNFDKIRVECIDTETVDKVMEYSLGWDKEKECLRVTTESYTDPDIKKGMISDSITK